MRDPPPHLRRGQGRSCTRSVRSRILLDRIFGVSPNWSSPQRRNGRGDGLQIVGDTSKSSDFNVCVATSASRTRPRATLLLTDETDMLYHQFDRDQSGIPALAAETRLPVWGGSRRSSDRSVASTDVRAGSKKELGTGLVNSIKKNLGLK